MNPVFIFLVILGAAILWLLCASFFRLIGGIATHLVKKAEKAMSDEPSKKDAFVAGFKDSMRNGSPKENSGETSVKENPVRTDAVKDGSDENPKATIRANPEDPVKEYFRKVTGFH